MGITSSIVPLNQEKKKFETIYDWNAPLRSRLFARVQCRFEGGKNCTRENPDAQTRSVSPLPGLHCDWIDSRLLAMARPWEQNLIANDHSLVKRMYTEGIRLVLNLQEYGEHAHCGPGLADRSGFSYHPETFMQNGIRHTCLAWLDMSVPNLKKMCDICHVIDGVVNHGGKVAVHCHAGLGRTGLVCACFMVFHDGMQPAEAVARVRTNRPGAIQTQRQETFVHMFSLFMRYLRLSIPPPNVPSSVPESRAQRDRRERSRPRSSRVGPDPSGPSASGTSVHLERDMPWDARLRMRPGVTSACSSTPSEALPFPRTLEDHIHRQRLLLHGDDLRRHWGSPFLLNRVLEGIPAVAGARGLPALLDCLDFQLPWGENGSNLKPHVRESAASLSVIDLPPDQLLGLAEALLASLQHAPLDADLCSAASTLVSDLLRLHPDSSSAPSTAPQLTATTSTGQVLSNLQSKPPPPSSRPRDEQLLLDVIDALHDLLPVPTRALLACSLVVLNESLLTLAKRDDASPLDFHKAAFLLCSWFVRLLTRDCEEKVDPNQLPLPLIEAWGKRYFSRPGAKDAASACVWTPWTLLVYGFMAHGHLRHLRTRKGTPGGARLSKGLSNLSKRKIQLANAASKKHLALYDHNEHEYGEEHGLSQFSSRVTTAAPTTGTTLNLTPSTGGQQVQIELQGSGQPIPEP